MNQTTRSEVLALLQQFDQEFMIFEGAEEAFILKLLQNDLGDPEQHDVDWHRLSKATFVLPLCYIRSRDGSPAGIPDWLVRQAKGYYLHQISSNESRLQQIQDLARLFESAELKVLFVKGAAELVYCSEDTDFLGQRYMCDIDLLCAPADLNKVDEVLTSHGYTLWHYDRNHWTKEQVCKFSLEQYGHYVYNACHEGYMEVHAYMAVGANRLSYPPDFERALLEECQKVNLRGTDVWVPKPEHLVVHSLCHAASRNNNQALVYMDRFYLDDLSSTDCMVSPPVLVNKRLDISQLRFLVQVQGLLDRFENSLDFVEVKELLSKVSERDLTEMYMSAASYVFQESCPLVPGASFELLQASRHRYVSRYMLPLLAERIESIITSRLEQVTSDYIDRHVERIAATLEQRVLHCIAERVIGRARNLVGRRLKGIIPGALDIKSTKELALKDSKSSS